MVKLIKSSAPQQDICCYFTKEDFVSLVKSDLDIIGITYNIEEMFCKMSHAQYIKNIFAAAFNDFRSIQVQHSKVKDIPYKGLVIQKYLKSPELYNSRL